MATIDGIGLAEPSTVTKSLAAVLIQRNSSNTYQEVMVIGDPDSTTSSALMKVTNSAPGSTTWAAAVRIVGGPSTATDFAVRALLPSTAADNPVTATFASTGNTVLARLTTSSGGGVEGSTSAPAHNTFGLHTRSLRPNLITVTSTAGTDTTVTLISSAATTPRILSYTVVSTVAGPIRAGFYAGSTLLWPVLIWADGGIAKDGQSGTLPGFLFTGQADRPVQFSQGSTGHCTVALTYWQE